MKTPIIHHNRAVLVDLTATHQATPETKQHVARVRNGLRARTLPWSDNTWTRLLPVTQHADLDAFLSWWNDELMTFQCLTDTVPADRPRPDLRVAISPMPEPRDFFALALPEAVRTALREQYAQTEARYAEAALEEIHARLREEIAHIAGIVDPDRDRVRILADYGPRGRQRLYMLERFVAVIEADLTVDVLDRCHGILAHADAELLRADRAVRETTYRDLMAQADRLGGSHA